ncbi:flavodoxin family protein [Candidatus Bipolaricaulota bacterium]|nr:flavodoxin family protein [Candidatus Bipolaricaulota bacterium]
MKALLISGSPREESNTEAYLRTAQETLAENGVETEIVTLVEKTINPCKACYMCWQAKSYECQQHGDDFHPLFGKMVAADAIIVGTPVHYSAVHPSLWSLLVRASFPGIRDHPHSGPRLFDRKIGGPITVARRAGQNFALAQLLLWFNLNNFVIPGSMYWNVGVARSIGDAAKDEEGMDIVKQFAENVAWLLEKTCEQKSKKGDE